MRHYSQPWLDDYAKVQERGNEFARREPRFFRSEIAKGRGNDTAIILYTSGTTGQPKGVVLSFDNIITTAGNAIAFEGLTEREEVLAYLPMAWIGEHIFSYAQAYCAGFCASCPESQATVMLDLRELGPTYFFAPPRIFESILTQVMIRMEDSGWAKRRLFHFFLDFAKRVGPAILDRHRVPLAQRMLYWLGDLLVYGPLKNTLGFSRIRVAYTAGEAIGPDLFTFYRSLGINLKQLYGMTESSVFLRIQRDGAVKVDGAPIEEVEIRIAEDGEVLFKSPGAFQCYYKNPEATAAAKRPDGWVHTGDSGFFDAEGQLKILRPRQGCRTAMGRCRVCPEIHREQAQILSLDQGGGGVRRRPAVCRRLCQYRPRGGRRLGGAAQSRLCLLPGIGRRGSGLRSSAGLHRARQPRPRDRACPGAFADRPVPDPAQGARCR
jgi:long-chain acyl-CoA synthetase